MFKDGVSFAHFVGCIFSTKGLLSAAFSKTDDSQSVPEEIQAWDQPLNSTVVHVRVNVKRNQVQ